MTDLVLIQVKALAAFTKTTHHGQFHGDPNGLSDRTRFPSVPNYVVEALVGTGKAVLLGDEIEPSPPSPTPYSREALPPVDSPFTMTHQGFGKYLIEGPGIAPDTLIKGKADAETFVAQAEKAHAEAEAALAAAADDAPVD